MNADITLTDLDNAIAHMKKWRKSLPCTCKTHYYCYAHDTIQISPEDTIKLQSISKIKSKVNYNERTR